MREQRLADVPAQTNPLSIDIASDAATGLKNLFALIQAIECELKAGGFGILLATQVPRLSRMDHERRHSVSNRFTRAVVAQCQALARGWPRASSYRLSSESFAVLMPGATPEQGGREESKLRRSLVEALRDFGMEVSVPLTIGAVYSAEKSNLAQLLVTIELGLHPPDGALDPAGLNTMRDWSARFLDKVLARAGETLSLAQESRRLALTDDISGLPNHRAAKASIEAMVEAHRLHAADCAVLFVDGDNLKLYNDRFGYEAGNSMIRELGKSIIKNLRRSDYVARWLSGDEFLVLLAQTDQHQALLVADRLQQAVTRTFEIWPYPVTVSIGVAMYPEHGASAASLTSMAERALANAKQAGRNRIALAQEDQEPSNGTAAPETKMPTSEDESREADQAPASDQSLTGLTAARQSQANWATRIWRHLPLL